ncbi:hypothetical protein MWU52_05310 [Jannaschia sp. S6380]|uniref:hypothetical protein n=1 Tax=Jannaschia sp. S6380 TaxID=2926408 RepID=UPI001FF4934C|nr:hypothetical protein [Jannaschia sp. S6380]MCK0166964.1 hypothetical protein [Jannaschia sp. S6380]
MSEKIISYSVRQPQEVADQIDAIARKNGFGTRAKFMTYAALHHDGETDDVIAAELARISFALHQLNRAETGRVHLLKRRDILAIGREARAALRSVIDRNA